MPALHLPNIGGETDVDILVSRSVTDGATTAASTTVTSATAAFTSSDVGATISGGSIPVGATISSVTNATTVVISAAATATATAVALTIGNQVIFSSPALASLPLVASPDIVHICVDPDGIAGAPEWMKITAHTAAATTATVARASEGSTARKHKANIEWVHTLAPSEMDGSGVTAQTEPPTGATDYDLWLDTDAAAPITSAAQVLPSLLAITSLNPATEGATNSTVATYADVHADAFVTFTVPDSGAVVIGMTAATATGPTTSLNINLREGATDLAGTAARVWRGSNATASPQSRWTHRVHLTGLTPGTVKTYKMGLARGDGTGTATVEWGGIWGPLIMEVHDAATSQGTIIQSNTGVQLLHVRDEKASGTHGGTPTAGAWNTRTLNTVKTNEIAGASLAANVVSLPAGTYEVEAAAPAYRSDRHRLRLYDVTGAATLVVGQSLYNDTTDNSATNSALRGRFTLAVTSNVRLDHWFSSATGAGLGFGVGSGTGEVEVYADLQIRKVA